MKGNMHAEAMFWSCLRWKKKFNMLSFSLHLRQRVILFFSFSTLLTIWKTEEENLHTSLLVSISSLPLYRLFELKVESCNGSRKPNTALFVHRFPFICCMALNHKAYESVRSIMGIIKSLPNLQICANVYVNISLLPNLSQWMMESENEGHFSKLNCSRCG